MTEDQIWDCETPAAQLLDTYEGQASPRLVLDMVKTHYEEESEQ